MLTSTCPVLGAVTSSLPLEVSSYLCIYGALLSRLEPALMYADSPMQARDAYASRYKGMWVCLQALARAMSGSYVNFGVFDLYGDPALKVSAAAADLDLLWIRSYS